MASIEAYGISAATSAQLGQAKMDFAANGLVEGVATPLGFGRKVVVADGLVELVSTCLAAPSFVPSMSSVVALTSLKIRVTFDSQMTDNDDLRNLDNYTITPTGNGATVYKSSITPENVTYPSYVDIVISEMTNNHTYQCVVETGSSGPVNRQGLHIKSAGATETFSGIGIVPEIESVESLGQNTVKITFTEAMEDNDTIRDALKYSFDNGLSVVAVTSFSVDSVYLETSDQVAGLLYTLTITT